MNHMINIHDQRLTVLLFFFCSVYSGLFLSCVLDNNLNILYSYDLLIITTQLFSSSILLDSTSVSFSAVVIFIAANVFIFSRYYISNDIHYYRFSWLLLVFVISINILIMAGSLLVLLLGWDGLGVSSFALIIYYESNDSIVASFLTLLINRLGDIIIIGSIVVFVIIGFSVVVNYSISEVFLISFLFSCAALTNSAQYPFCVWLPAAIAAPTPVSALVHSSTLVTAGIYIIIRICSSNNLPIEIQGILLFFGSVTSFIGGICAVYENDLNNLIALSTLSQLGVIIFSLGLGAYNLALLHLYTHAIFNALLFLVAGCILLQSYGVQDIRLLGAITNNSPILLVFLNISGFCLMGLPFLSAFYSNHLILTAMWHNHINLISLFLILFSTILSSVYITRMLKCLNWSYIALPLVSAPNSTPLYYVPLSFLFAGSCFLGWGLTSVELQYTESFFIPFWLDSVLYALIIIGLFWGIVLRNPVGNNLAANMFYIVPVWCNINIMVYQLFSVINSLDYGWLEPASYSNGSLLFFSNNIFLFRWLRLTISFLPHVVMLVGSIFFFWYLAK